MTKPTLESSAPNDRQSIRKKILTKRKTLTSTFQTNAAQSLLSSLQNDIDIKRANHIALYLAVNGELDLQPFIHWCWQQQKQVYLPVVHPFSNGHLLFLRYDNTSTMVKNQYHIEEPRLDIRHIKPIQELEVILTPLVAFDNTGARIGMGGGYYDRTLANWHKNQHHQSKYNFYPIGIAYDFQQIAKVPCEHWDIPLPKIITPTQNINCHLGK